LKGGIAMINTNKNRTSDSSTKEFGKQETSNRIDELTNIVEKHTRTERHLEQHSDIASPEQVHHAEKIQKEREDRIDDLKDKIMYGDGGPTNQVENLEKNITFAEGYLDHNEDHMNKKDKQNLKNRIENEKDTLNWLK
jgi:hypothetical protein